MATTKIPISVAIADGLVIRPGDKLIIRVSTKTTDYEFDHLGTQLRANLPGIEIAVICAEQLAVVRKEAPTSLQDALRHVVERAKAEARAGAPAEMVARYVAVEAEHIIAGHQGDAMDCDTCITTTSKET